MTGSLTLHHRALLGVLAALHWISRDAATNRIVRETTFDRGHSLTFDAQENSLRTRDDVGTTPPWSTLAQEAAIWKDLARRGSGRNTGCPYPRPGLRT
jgi:hypothetical protein